MAKISYTRYNRQSVSENVSFNAEKVKRKAFKGKPASFKQGIYATNCGDMIGCETAEIGSGLCIELLKNAEDSADETDDARLDKKHGAHVADAAAKHFHDADFARPFVD